MFKLAGRVRIAVRILLLMFSISLLPACSTLSSATSDPAAAQSAAAQPITPAQSQDLAAAFNSRVRPTLPGNTRAVTASAAGVASSPTDYLMGVGDRVRIDVHGEPDLSMDFAVSQSGTVNYPFLGDLPVLGTTVGQLQSRIERGLRNGYLVNPDVRVIVTEYRKFYINGEVRLPGGYSFVTGLTVRQAAALAGGFTERASMNKISVYREATPTIPLSANLDTPINPGDTVVVAQGLF